MTRWWLSGALIAFVTCALSGCAMTSDVMDMGNGVYMISAHAAPIRGGETGAQDVAYSDANKYCQDHAPGQHAIVVDSQGRDVYQGSIGWNQYGGGGGIFAAGNVTMRFRCGT